MITEKAWNELWEARWDAEQSDSSDVFHQRFVDLTQTFCEIIEEINEDLPEEDRYQIDVVSQGLQILQSTTDIYGTGVLPLGFFLTLKTPGTSEVVDVFQKISEKDEKYFSIALGSFFPQEVRNKFVKPYLDLFTAVNSEGDPLVCDEDRSDLWGWIHSLIRKMAEYISGAYPSLAHITNPLKVMGST